MKDPSVFAGIGFYTRVTAVAKGFNFQIINSFLESMGLRLTWLDCNVLSYNKILQAISGLPQATSWYDMAPKQYPRSFSSFGGRVRLHVDLETKSHQLCGHYVTDVTVVLLLFIVILVY